MKTPKHLALCVWVILAAACSSTDKAKIPNITNMAMGSELPTDNLFKQQPASTILDFLKWYRSNVTQLKKIEMVSHSGSHNSGPYTVNFKGTEAYLDALQKSGFVSDKYVDNWREYFEKCDANFKKNPQTEGPAKGFEFDFIMWAKDYDEDLTNIEKSKVEFQKFSGDQGAITIGLPTVGRVKYKVTRQGDKWVIDDIKDLRSALDQPQND